ncbi:MAG: hypothetical protein WAR83_01330 [Flavobacteriales bacterium]|nr:hypothetical protein [Flavobacteriales bacterium]
MRVFLISVLLLLVSGLQAQEILSQERYPDGTLRSTRYSEGGRIHFITYFENGQVMEIGCFEHGKRDGTWKQYSATGALTTSAYFDKGRSQGTWEFRTEDDKPIGRLSFMNGALTQGQQFNDAGDLVAQRDYR